MKYLPNPAILNILVRNMRRGGMTDSEIAAALHKRLNLARFDYNTLSPADRARYDELTRYLATFAKKTK